MELLMLVVHRSIVRSFTLLAAALVVAGCGELAQAPPLARGAPLALALAFPGGQTASSVFGADVDGVRIIVARQNESTVLDTMIPWALRDAEFRLAVNLQLIQRVETLYVNVDLLAGQATRFYGYGSFIVREEALPALPPLELFYVGPGSDAVFITVTPRGLRLSPNGANQMTANVQNGQGLPVAPPVAWSVSDTRLARISATGMLTAKSALGSFYVRAATPSGLADSALVLIATQSP